MDIHNFSTEVARMQVNGQTVTVIKAHQPTLAHAAAVLKVVLVGDDPDELLSSQTFLALCRGMVANVQRRRLTPQGQWVVGNLPLDWPLWRDYVSETARDRASKALDHLDGRGHVAVFALIDSVTVTDYDEQEGKPI